MSTVIGFDTETSLIRPGRTAPPISCLSYQAHVDGETFDPVLVADLDDIRKLVASWLSDPSVTIVGHNVPFDLAVLAAEWPEFVTPIFQALDADRVTDTRTRQKLLDIAGGCYRGRFGDGGKWVKYDYSLLALAKRMAGIPIKKEGFRMFYGPLRGVPLEQWPDAAKELQARGQAWLDGQADVTFSELAASFGDFEKFRTEVRGMVAADPSEVVTYPLDDARSTLAVFLAQEVHADPYLADQFRQARRAWWLHLASAWGLRTNAAGVAQLQLATERAVTELEGLLQREGLVRKDGSRDTVKAKQRMLTACGWAFDAGLGNYQPTRDDHLPLRLTDAGEPSLDADACKAADDEVLKAYAELTSLKTVLNKDVPALAKGAVTPVHTNFDMAETGRTTSSNPNVQNWRRLPGIRECFVPRPGHVFAQADYSGLELATLAQACLDLLGQSRLADAINSGLDPHTELASTILGIPAEEGRKLRKAKDHDFDNARQTAKVANFGFPGGLGAPKLVLFARKSYGVEMTEDEARALKEQWLTTWPEMRRYFFWVNNGLLVDGVEDIILPVEKACRHFLQHSEADFEALCKEADLTPGDVRDTFEVLVKKQEGVHPDPRKALKCLKALRAELPDDCIKWIPTFSLEQLRSGRIRGGATYTAACNSFFQGLGADATGHAGWVIAKACYVDRGSPLFGCRIVNYVHDEFIVEAPIDRGHEAAEELSRLMIEGASEWIPDVRLAAEPCLMTVWSKDAKTLRDANGRLVPWSPEPKKVAA